MAPPPPPDRPLRGAAILVGLLFSAFFVYTFTMFPGLVLLLVPTDGARRLLRRWEGWAAAQWLAFGGWMLEVVGGVRISVTGDTLPPNERAFVISNHRTRIDWMFLWCLAARLRLLPSYRVILKADLRSYPWWGWGMSACAFIFIKRGSQNRARDLGRVETLCRYLLRLGVANSLILFPEGTDLSPSNQQKDAEYASKQGLKPYTHVLHPRGGAFATSLAVLRQPGGIEALYDLTMAYDDYAPGERPNELSLLRGRLPHKVHIHVQRVPVAELPKDGAQCEAFLAQTFERKEARLKRFYEQGVPLEEQEEKEEKEPGPGKGVTGSRGYANAARAAYAQGLLVMALTAAGVVALARWLSPWAFWGYVLAATGVTVLVVRRCEGWDSLELRLGGEEGWDADGGRGKAA